MWWLLVAGSVVVGFCLGAYFATAKEQERLAFWRQKAIDLQVRVHELEGR